MTSQPPSHQPDDVHATERMSRRRFSRTRIVVTLFVVTAVVCVAVGYLPAGQYIRQAMIWVEQAGPVGMIATVVLYVAVTVLVLPAFPLAVAAGFIYGLVWGTVVVAVGSTLGACGAFLLGRFMGRSWIESKLTPGRRLAGIDRAVGRSGFRLVFLLRTNPLTPYNVMNYAMALTAVPFWKYALASLLGVVPGTFVYVYAGAGVRSVADSVAGVDLMPHESGPVGQVFFWAGLALTVVLVIVIARMTRRALQQEQAHTTVEDPHRPSEDTNARR